MTLDPVTGGGSAMRTVHATRALADRGVECAIATTDEGLGPDLLEMLRRVRVIRMPAFGGRFRIPRGGTGALRRAVRDADVVLLVNHWTAINVLASRYAEAAGVPYVVCPAGALPVEGGRSQGLKRLYNACFGRRIVAHAAAHIAVTDDERLQFEAYGVDAARVVVIPNGMPDVKPGDGRAFRARHDLGPGPLVLFLGRLAPIKGPDLLLSAFSALSTDRPDWRLVLAGPDDGMRGALEELAARLGLTDRVRFIGYVNDVAKSDALAATDLVVVPSRREAMSIVVLEAAAASRPVLVTDRCGLPEVARAGGWVVPATVEGLTAGLLDATRDRAALPARGERWHRTALDRYAWPAVANRYMELFASVRPPAR
jgi:glycosyltransferase involved in cell wall biosynthesis